MPTGHQPGGHQPGGHLPDGHLPTGVSASASAPGPPPVATIVPEFGCGALNDRIHAQGTLWSILHIEAPVSDVLTASVQIAPMQPKSVRFSEIHRAVCIGETLTAAIELSDNMNNAVGF